MVLVKQAGWLRRPLPLLAAVAGAVVLVGCSGSPGGRVGGRAGAGHPVRLADRSATPPAASPVPGEWTADAQLGGVSCPAVTTCVAVGQSASDQGAVLRSSDGGATWAPAGVPVGAGQLVSVSCPTTSMCVAAGDSTAFQPAVYLSDDGGRQWARATVPVVPAPLRAVACASPAVCVAVGGAVTARGASPVALHSGDGGRTWVAGALPSGVNELAAVACPSVTDCVAVGQAGATDPVVVQSGDGGAAWVARPVPVGGFLPGAVACPAVNACVLVGYDENRRVDVFLSSADGGAAWELAPDAGGSAPGGGQPTAVACVTATRCLAVTQPAMGVATGVVSTTADGKSWSSAAHLPPDALPAAVACPEPARCVTVGGSDGGGLAWTTTDGGSSWSPSTTPTALGTLRAVRCWTAQACVTVGQSPLMTPLALWTADGGRTWAAGPAAGEQAGLDALACPGRGTCVAVGGNFGGIGNAVVMRTADGGRRWQTEQLAEDGTLQAVACPTARLCVAGGTTFSQKVGEVPQVTVVSTDGGRTWRRLAASPDTAAFAGLACPTRQRCLAVAGGLPDSPVVLAVADPGAPGARWVVRSRVPPSWRLGSVTCPTASTCLAAGITQPAGAGRFGDLVVESHDGGRTWQVATAYPPYGGADAVGCVSATRCAVVGDGLRSQGAGALVSVAGRFHPAALPKGVGNLYGVTCPMPDRCLAVGTVPGTAAVLVSDDAGAHWHAQQLPRFVSLSPPLQPTS